MPARQKALEAAKYKVVAGPSPTKQIGSHFRELAPDAIVMHPQPMNRGIEIASDVADGPQSAIRDQVRNGVAVRMAVLAEVILNRS